MPRVVQIICDLADLSQRIKENKLAGTHIPEDQVWFSHISDS